MSAPRQADDRRRELGLIHMAKANLALADDSYRAILARVAGVGSAADLDASGRARVIAHFKSLGWNPAKRRKAARAAGRARADSGLVRKIRALWLSLWQLGALADPGEAALAAFVKRQTKVDAPDWLTAAQCNAVIEALKSWCAREGFSVPDAGTGGERAALIDAQWEKLIALGAFKTGAWAKLETWLRKRFKVAHQGYLDPAQQDRAIEMLGAWVRKAKAEKAAADAARR